MRYIIFILISFSGMSCEDMRDRFDNSNSHSSQLDHVSAYAMEADLNVEDEYTKIAPPMTASPVIINENPTEFPPQEPIIIKEGHISIETDKLSLQKSRVDSLVKAHEAYYQKEDFYTRPNSSTFQLILRIPGSTFNQFVKDLGYTSDKIISQSINSKDVTEDYIDIETRMKNNEVYLERYLELLNKADSVKDMITIQDKVRLLQAEIESMQGRLKYMENRSSLSTLNLTLVNHHPVVTTAEDDHFFTRMSSSFVTGYNVMIEILLFAMSVWPIILIVLLVRWSLKRYSKYKLPFVKPRT